MPASLARSRTAGDANGQSGMAAHVYAANVSMVDDHFFNADGEMLVVPQVGEEESELADQLIARLGGVDFDRTVFEREEYQAFAFLRRLVDPSH